MLYANITGIDRPTNTINDRNTDGVISVPGGDSVQRTVPRNRQSDHPANFLPLSSGAG